MIQTSNIPDYAGIKISLASPELIRGWSYGEVSKPETVNYRTLRPEKDGLFCERIFGPTKDWECYCGKYKKIRYKGVICDRCGVEVARAKVRRERMGHIQLAAPVSHIWFTRGTPSRLGVLLDLSPRNLERVLYFAQYVIISIDEDSKEKLVTRIQEEGIEYKARLQEKVNSLKSVASSKDDAINTNLSSENIDSSETSDNILDPEAGDHQEDPFGDLDLSSEEKIQDAFNKIDSDTQDKIERMEALAPLQMLSESRFRELRDEFGDVFIAGMGAEAILDILQRVNLQSLYQELQEEIASTTGQRRKKAIKRLKVVKSLYHSNNKPEWMILKTLPVLPPELRPMVQLDGGRFATSDLNDLYRRVINRNNRLKRLLELGAPEIIVRNEKRMLQESVDALIDNGRRGRTIAGSHNHKLKSLSDLLRGKQGRFRQNLLGKRVDYSGRSVIVVGPSLELHQCGLPKKMALELFKPFVMNKLVEQGLAHNIKSARRMVERVRPEVWDILEDIIKTRPVLLNRAPTLHRLGIQAFQPVLVEGSAIQIHPLVCTAFNADFDGDQMAVHVPLSTEAVLEARRIMLSTNNMLSPSSGEPIVAPTLDMVLGSYYLTMLRTGATGEGKRFLNKEEARLYGDLGLVDLHAEIVVQDDGSGTQLKTTIGRIIFNEAIPKEVGFYNRLVDKQSIKEIVSDCYRLLGNEGTAKVLDKIKDVGFRYATQSGITIAINDITVSKEKAAMIDKASEKIANLQEQYGDGLLTPDERYKRAVDIWTEVSDDMTSLIEKTMPNYGGIYFMAQSGAKGNIAQVKQMAGMRGLMSNARGKVLDLPIKSSFREGLTVLEYFISTHGARKGLADTALRTADSGYLTRRLIDIAQEIIVLETDCGTEKGVWVISETAEEDIMVASFEERLIGRHLAEDLVHPKTGKIIGNRNQEIDEDMASKLTPAKVEAVFVRSTLLCESEKGACQLCYGRSLATGRSVMLGEAVGIIAAQSIGEPGTQLTMRTFHTGGVAGVDITSGLPRVEELFEARVPKSKALLSEIEGNVEVFDSGILIGTDSALPSGGLKPPISEGKVVRVTNEIPYSEEYRIPRGYKPSVVDGAWVESDAVLVTKPRVAKESKLLNESTDGSVRSSNAGTVKVMKTKIKLFWDESDSRDYPVPATANLVVKTGETVRAGQPLTKGQRDPHDILRIQGREAVERYLRQQVQTVYMNQGVSINDKHIEVIVRQMLRRVRVDFSGDTELLPGQLVDRLTIERTNAKILAEGGEPATASPVLLGVTRASLNTDSFLAAASFQETARVLTEATITGSMDSLQGLKENVIIGRLIPARFDLSEEGRIRLGFDKLEEERSNKKAQYESLGEPNEMATSEEEELQKQLIGDDTGLGDEVQPTESFLD
tara:strand:+ start:371 stop:4540 length:4170 start_codon:yes stop_codon:yes gene_type:complete